MARCFCGCDEKVSGFAGRGMNKQGRRTVEQVEKLNLLKSRSLQLAEDLDELEEVLPGSNIGQQGQGGAIALTDFANSLNEMIAAGDTYADDWHSFLHDDLRPPEGVMEYKRAWLAWGKASMTVTPILKAPDEELVSFALALMQIEAADGPF